MSKVRVTLVRSLIDRPKTQKETAKALGIKKMHSSAVHELNPSIQGMINKISHLLKVEEV